ncbi:wsv502 [White spot syndrome virus]|uniref:Wsv502 n=1 Tax=White spot syndrome virus TaxID=342409 RepID=A0A1Z2R9N9_9VIRU|nr:wsv502 [White spot syndrome virus]
MKLRKDCLPFPAVLMLSTHEVFPVRGDPSTNTIMLKGKTCLTLSSELSLFYRGKNVVASHHLKIRALIIYNFYILYHSTVVHLRVNMSSSSSSSFSFRISTYQTFLKALAHPDLVDKITQKCDETGRNQKCPIQFLADISHLIQGERNGGNLFPLHPFKNQPHLEPRIVGSLHGRTLDNDIEESYCYFVKDLYNGVFSYVNGVKELQGVLDKKISGSGSGESSSSRAPLIPITDVDLLYIFGTLVVLPPRSKAYRVITEAVLALPFNEFSNNWPPTNIKGAYVSRDFRMFNLLAGLDHIEGEVGGESEWESIHASVVKRMVTIMRNKAEKKPPSTSRIFRVYVAEPVNDAVTKIPIRVLSKLFGSRLAGILQKVYSYSMLNLPYLLSSNSIDIKQGVKGITLSIPSARKLGFYLLQKDTTLQSSLSQDVADCIVSINAGIIGDDFSEKIRQCIEEKNKPENCCMCFCEIDKTPDFSYSEHVARHNFFPVHAFSSSHDDKCCGAKICSECIFPYIISLYEKMTGVAGVKVVDLFQCPGCKSGMLNLKGRCYEFSNLCKRMILPYTSTHCSSLFDATINRAEACFYSLEFLQYDFETARRIAHGAKDIPHVYNKVVKNVKDLDRLCALYCYKCVSPVVCDEPNESTDYEMVDVTPPLINLTEIVDSEEYDDGPGNHMWPAKFTCNFIAGSSGETPTISTCRDAVTFLGRAPRKKMAGWDDQSAVGQAIIALANWRKSGELPKNMFDLLEGVNAVLYRGDSFLLRAINYPCVIGRSMSPSLELVKRKVNKIALIKAFFHEKRVRPDASKKLLEWAELLVKSYLMEVLLQTPECVIHRAHSFVGKTLLITDELVHMRPDDATRNAYIQNLNAARQNAAAAASFSGSLPKPEFVPCKEKTIEWMYEKDNDDVRVVNCPSCKKTIQKYGGCVNVFCECGTNMCWICEEKVSPADSNHCVEKHRIVYSNCVRVKYALESMYGFEICTMKNVEEGVKNYYVMENGFFFDVQEMVAKK